MIGKRCLIGLVVLGITIVLIIAACAPKVTPMPAQQVEEAPTATVKPTPEVNPACIHPNGQVASGTVYWNYAGGIVQEIQEKIWIKPYKELCGVDIVSVSPTNFGKIKEMVQAGQVEWDMYRVNSPAEYYQGVENGMWKELTPGLFNGYNMAEGSVLKYGYWDASYNTAIVFSKDAFPDGSPQPLTPQDFFDVEKFPGPRCLSKYPMDNLELAHIADGNTGYPIDVEAALKKLATIKDHVPIWWETGNQPLDGLETGECVIADAWHGRAYHYIKQGSNFGISYAGTFLRPSCCNTIIKDSPNWVAAETFIRWMHQPEVYVPFIEEFVYAGPNLDAVKLIPEETAKNLNISPQNYEVMAGVTDELWWADNNDEIQRRFDEWFVSIYE